MEFDINQGFLAVSIFSIIVAGILGVISYFLKRKLEDI